MKYEGYIFKIKPNHPAFEGALSKYKPATVKGLLPEKSKNTTSTKNDEVISRNVFVVHGHDEAIKHELARFLEMLELKPIILHEKPNEGKTLIEKFEKHADVGYAVVLLTPDDVGISNNPPEGTHPVQQPRARQNVILELGYFIGALGRDKVCALYSKGVELPSDLSGIVYVELDKAGKWKFEVAREIKASGIGIDMNKAV